MATTEFALVIGLIVLLALWFTVRSYRRSQLFHAYWRAMVHNLAAAETRFGESDRKLIAAYVLKRMGEDATLVDFDRTVLNTEAVAASEKIVERAQSDIIAARKRGAVNLDDLEYCAASIVEAWALARMKGNQHQIPPNSFDEIDKLVWTFLRNYLSPEEIGAALGG